MISLFSLGKHFSVLELELQAEEMGRWEKTWTRSRGDSGFWRMNESTGIREHAALDWGRGRKASHGAFKPSHTHTHGYTPGFGGAETVLSVLTKWLCSLRTKPWLETGLVLEESPTYRSQGEKKTQDLLRLKSFVHCWKLGH